MKNSKEYLDKISKIIDKPYFYELKNYGIVDFLEVEYVLKRVNGIFGIRMGYGDWSKWGYNQNNMMIYLESDNGEWIKYEYDSNDHLIYYENSSGFWCKREWENDKNIYYEDSNGCIINKG